MKKLTNKKKVIVISAAVIVLVGALVLPIRKLVKHIQYVNSFGSDTKQEAVERTVRAYRKNDVLMAENPRKALEYEYGKKWWENEELFSYEWEMHDNEIIKYGSQFDYRNIRITDEQDDYKLGLSSYFYDVLQAGLEPENISEINVRYEYRWQFNYGEDVYKSMKIKSHSLLCILATIAFSSPLTSLSVNAQKAVSKTWNPNLKNGMYRNPVIDADYSDPDVCRVGNDYYMTSSSFQCFPGLQILHSTDLVNWEIIGAALLDDYPVLPEYQGTELDWRKKVQHGNYVWAPSIRYHDGWFYIYCGDPDQGLFMTKTQDPRGPWEPITWVMKGKGLIDCCPLWDEDGKAYLSHGCAGSRAGIKSVLFVAPMSPDGTKVIGPSRIVYDGHEDQPTIEGTKFYKRNGYYYIMSPAGGVKYGWQVELRSKNPFGPYEEYVGMAQGKNKKVNGPHQGAWVDTQNGEDWFLHFQDKHAYGRVVHLQPAKWVNDWLVIGDDKDGDGCGDPVQQWKKPNLPSSGNFQPKESDDFNSVDLGLQWQWNGPYSQYWYFCDAKKSKLRLYGVQQAEDVKNLFDLPNLLLQKLPTENFTATAKVKFIPNRTEAYKEKDKVLGESAGMIMQGMDYAALKFVDTKEEGVVLQYVTCEKAEKGQAEKVVKQVAIKTSKQPQPYTVKYAVDDIPSSRIATQDVWLRVKVHSEGIANQIKAIAEWSYSLDGKKFTKIGNPFTVREGKWIGAKLGFFNTRTAKKNDAAFFDVDWIHFEK